MARRKIKCKNFFCSLNGDDIYGCSVLLDYRMARDCEQRKLYDNISNILQQIAEIWEKKGV